MIMIGLSIKSTVQHAMNEKRVVTPPLVSSLVGKIKSGVKINKAKMSNAQNIWVSFTISFGYL
jgi:hypothetical protein